MTRFVFTGVVISAIVTIGPGMLAVEANDKGQPSTSEAIYRDQVQPILASNCYRCHGKSKQAADLRLDLIGDDFSDRAVVETWHDVLNRINQGEMPPDDEPQLTSSELRGVVGWLTSALRRAADAQRTAGGRLHCVV